MLRTGESLAVELERAIYDQAKGIMKMRRDKFISMMSVLMNHTHMRTRLLDRTVSPADMVRMKRDDFLSSELKRQKSEAEEMRMQS